MDIIIHQNEQDTGARLLSWYCGEECDADDSVRACLGGAHYALTGNFDYDESFFNIVGYKSIEEAEKELNNKEVK